jgi:hypothetical protein
LLGFEDIPASESGFATIHDGMDIVRLNKRQMGEDVEGITVLLPKCSF